MPLLALGLTQRNTIAFLSSLTEHPATVCGSETLLSIGFSKISPNGILTFHRSQRTGRPAGNTHEKSDSATDVFVDREHCSIPATTGSASKQNVVRNSS